MKHSKKKLIPVILLLIIAAIVGVTYFNNPQRTGEMTLNGEIETTIYSNITEVSGKILEMNVELGQQVKKGDVIAVIDATAQKYAIQQAEYGMDKKQQALKKLNKGAESQQIRQAQNSVSIAQSNYNTAKSTYSSTKETYEKAARDYQTALELYNNGGSPKAVLDNAKYAMDSAKYAMENASSATSAAQKQIDTAGQQVSLLVSGASDEDVASLLADISISESQLAQMRETLEKYTIRAQCDGVVMSKNYTEGAMVATGADIADIASDADKYIVVYVPKDNLHLVKYDQQVSFQSNTVTGKAVVKYIDVKSRYTPKDLQTAANKNKESMKVRMLLPTDSELIPGEQTKVVISTK